MTETGDHKNLENAERLAGGLPGLLLEADKVAHTFMKGVHGRRRVGLGESFWQFRSYQPGDQRRDIDWRQTAKRGEAFVRSLGFRQFRVRHHDRLARLEIPLEEIPRLWQEGRHEPIVTRFRELGYLYVAVDLAGFQSGSANLLLALKRSPRG